VSDVELLDTLAPAESDGLRLREAEARPAA
jgi:hypothetical protein